MSNDLEAVVQASIAGLGGGGDDGGGSGGGAEADAGGDTGDTGDTDGAGGEEAAGTEEGSEAAAGDEGGEGGAEGAEGDEEGAEGRVEAAEGKKKVVDDKKPAEEDPFAKEHGIKAKRKDGRENHIPYSRVVKITDNAVKKATAAFETVKAELTEQNTAQSTRLAELDAIGEIMATDPERFAEVLAGVNPAYAQLLSGKGSKAAADTTDKPKPDMDLGDGRLAYSPEAQDKLDEWWAAQTRKAVLEEVDKRFKPLNDERQQAALEKQMLPQITAQLADARANWDGFTANEVEILKVMREDRLGQAKLGKPPKLNMSDAWRIVCLPKIRADRNTMRAELTEEIKKIPTKTGTKTIVVKKRPANAEAEPVTAEGAVQAAVRALKTSMGA